MKPMKTKQRRPHFLSSGKTFAKGASLQSRRSVINVGTPSEARPNAVRCDAEGRSSFFCAAKSQGCFAGQKGARAPSSGFPPFCLCNNRVQPRSQCHPRVKAPARQMALVIWPWPGTGWICDVKMSKILGHFARAEK